KPIQQKQLPQVNKPISVNQPKPFPQNKTINLRRQVEDEDDFINKTPSAEDILDSVEEMRKQKQFTKPYPQRPSQKYQRKPDQRFQKNTFQKPNPSNNPSRGYIKTENSYNKPATPAENKDKESLDLR
ncbi:MAG: hypothetical protein WAX66_03170, partial [Patescibacteria group bacterium]